MEIEEITNSIKNYIIVDTFAYEIVNNETVMTDKPYYYIDFLNYYMYF